MAEQTLPEQVLAMLGNASDDEKYAVVEAIILSMRTPYDYSFDELDERLAAATRREAEAKSDTERLVWARRRFDLDFERRRRQPNRWLYFQSPSPVEYPEGLGPDDAYPDWLGRAQA